MDSRVIKGISQHASGVRMEGLTKVFPAIGDGADTVAVDNINMEINTGEMVTLLGPSGCGKTTTLRMISGFESPTSGEIYIGDAPMANIPPNKRGISMVFQSYALFPHLNIYENICYGLRVQRLPKAELERRTKDVIELMQLEGMETRFPNQLSGGQQQRVALARAVIIEPKVLLFDEPLSNLDAKLREHMRDELRSIQQRLGITSLYVTHDQSEAMAISDKVVIMKDGIIMQMGTPQQIYEFPADRFVANFIGKANFIPCKFKSKNNSQAVVLVGDKAYEIPNPGDLADIGEQNSCVLSLRPESIKLSLTGEGLAGVVSRAVYYGERVEYQVEVGETAVTVETYNPQLVERFAKGDTVFIDFDRVCARILK